MRRCLDIWPACGLPSSSNAMAHVQLLRQLTPWSASKAACEAGQSYTTPSPAEAQRHRLQLQQCRTEPQQHPSRHNPILRFSQLEFSPLHRLHQQQQSLSFASLPYRLTEEDDSTQDYYQQPAPSTAAAGYSIPATAARYGAPAGSSGRGSGPSTSGGSSSSSRGGTSGDQDDNDGDEPRRRRRSPPESRAALRRTTESRPAVEDVAVMSKTQLLRRKKAWLTEQCWERGLAHDGLKEDLVQRLLDWQVTDQGMTAAAEAVAAAQGAMAALAAARSSSSGMAAQSQLPQGNAAAATAGGGGAVADHSQGLAVQRGTTTGTSSSPAGDTPTPKGSADEVAENGSRQLATEQAMPLDLSDVGANSDNSNSTTSRQHRKSADSDNPAVDGSSSSSIQSIMMQDSLLQDTVGSAAQALEQPPRNAAAAAAGSVVALLQQLQEQPDNAALVAVARNALEVYVGRMQLDRASTDRSSTTGDTAVAAVKGLAAELSANSSAQSLAALAKACYSREVQSPLLAAAVADAVSAVAAQLGPQEVYGVLRLLVEHLTLEEQGFGDSQDGAGAKAMAKGFRALAEGMIKSSAALHSRQLTEAVQLLGQYKYDDPYGLWMIARDAAERLQEFEPADVVILLNAVAGMCVADDALCERVATVVGGSKASYSQQQLEAIETALKKMGCRHTW